MKKLKITLVLLVVATVTFAQQSPRKQATGNIGDVAVEVDYGAPSVRERVIWGELVPYGIVWRAGANENTTISFDKDVKINGSALAAGKYGFFIIPNENGEWIAIFSKKNDAWGAYSYAESDDALRVNVKPDLGNDVQEQLMYAVDNEGIVFAWDKAKLKLNVN